MKQTFIYPAILTPDKAKRVTVSFPDIPEALTDGANEAEALAEASDCLATALAGYLQDGRHLPPGRMPGRGEWAVSPPADVAMKLAIHQAMRQQNITTAELARRLGIDHKDARRLLDFAHHSKVAGLERALDTLGLHATTMVFDEARRDRIMRAPGQVASPRARLRPKLSIAVSRVAAK
jgi:antitoxin HicB